MAQIMKKTMVKKDNGNIFVKSKYNTLFVKKARFLGGSWDRESSAWSFPDSRESLVKELLREIYGTEGEEEPAIVTVQIDMDLFYDTLDSEIYLGGFPLASRRFRDADVKLAPWAYLVNGEFCPSGGSRNNPCVTWETGTVVKADVPAATYELEKGKEGITLCTVDIESLQKERESLIKRVAEIDQMLLSAE